jgi:enoyl-CoA hydratase/carnithine racemase
MFMPAARLGLHYYKSGIKRYVSRLGVDNAKKLFLTAQKIDAREMLRIGYLTTLVGGKALDEEVDRLATLLEQRTSGHARHEADDQRVRPRQSR